MVMCDGEFQNVYYPQALSSSFSLGSSLEFWKKIPKSFSSFQTKKKRKMSKMEEQDGSESNVATMRKLLSSYYGIDKEDVKSKQQDLDSEDFDADAVR
jgi:hypothetical protein